MGQPSFAVAREEDYDRNRDYVFAELVGDQRLNCYVSLQNLTPLLSVRSDFAQVIQDDTEEV